MMMKYESKRHPGTFMTTDGVSDAKFKTIVITLEDGKEQTISEGTLKRWWKLVDDESVEVVEEEPKIDNILESIITSAETEVVKKVDTTTKKATKTSVTKKKATTKSTKVDKRVVVDFRELLNSELAKLDVESFEYEGVKNDVLYRYNNKTVLRIHFGTKNLVIHVKENVVPKNVSYEIYKYFLSATIRCDYVDESKNLILTLMNNVIKLNSKENIDKKGEN